jgi:phosphoribosylanthranilate isomerase
LAAKIKICGVMRPTDAVSAAKAGASYLGVVFAEGPRTVTSDQAREVVSAASGVPVMGVFSDHRVDEILHIRDRAGLRGAQLHGQYSSASAALLRSAGLEVWRVVRIATPSDLDRLRDAIPDSDAVLVEPSVPHAKGGAGVPLDLVLARSARSVLATHRMALAGGLNPKTVTEALLQVQPEIVDVSSGVESLPGIKDPDKIVRFAEAVFAHSSIT